MFRPSGLYIFRYIYTQQSNCRAKQYRHDGLSHFTEFYEITSIITPGYGYKKTAQRNAVPNIIE